MPTATKPRPKSVGIYLYAAVLSGNCNAIKEIDRNKPGPSKIYTVARIRDTGRDSGSLRESQTEYEKSSKLMSEWKRFRFEFNDRYYSTWSSAVGGFIRPEDHGGGADNFARRRFALWPHLRQGRGGRSLRWKFHWPLVVLSPLLFVLNFERRYFDTALGRSKKRPYIKT